MRSHSDGVRSDVYRIPMLIGESESLYNCKMHDLSSFSQRYHFLNRLLDKSPWPRPARAQKPRYPTHSGFMPMVWTPTRSAATKSVEAIAILEGTNVPSPGTLP